MRMVAVVLRLRRSHVQVRPTCGTRRIDDVRVGSADKGLPKTLDLSLRLLPANRSYLLSHRPCCAFDIQRFLRALTGRKILLASNRGPGPVPAAPRAAHRQTPSCRTICPNPPRTTAARPAPTACVPVAPPVLRPAAAAVGRFPDESTVPGISVLARPSGAAANTIARQPRCGRSGRPARRPRRPNARRAAASTCGSRNTSCPARSASSTPAPQRGQLLGHQALAAGHSAEDSDDSASCG